MASEQIIVTARTAVHLNEKIDSLIEKGWEPIGAHQVVIIRNQLKYAGRQHMSTEATLEYSQSMVRNINV
jgi:hypothetical protein